MTDDEIREHLHEIDEDESIDVTESEADFLESILYRQKGRLSERQRDWAIDIIRKYEA